MHQYKVPILFVVLFILVILLFLNSREKTSGYSPVDSNLASLYKQVLMAEYPGQSSTLNEIPNNILYTLITDFKLDETRNYIVYKPGDYILLSQKDLNSSEVKDAIKKIKEKSSTLIQTDYKDFRSDTIAKYKYDIQRIASSSYMKS